MQVQEDHVEDLLPQGRKLLYQLSLEGGVACSVTCPEPMEEVVVVAILNCRFTASITYHDFLHGFWAGRGTGTPTLEAKLLQQLAALREEVLYVIFLDLHRAYYDLDRSR